ncbi:hypothetical protein BDZ85DRAFT_284044 [Elsinoe ampelina]|uniref:Actin-like ATPase domain-containing protein n=1 Tax=Elsinoe ampelina TaxID=302913 RepID=A0A6A6G6F5_9PEZI|nr:hypothetical protein BDZ85DRAFT_284044 [Elsinoe ampelina]
MASLPIRTVSSSENRIIVAIDFGTTHSGIAIVYGPSGRDPERIHVVKSWPGSETVPSEQVPTTVLYEVPTRIAGQEISEAVGNDASQPAGCTTTRFGHEISNLEDPIRCFKLLLEPGKDLPVWAGRTKTLTDLNKHGKTAIDASADYLRHLVAVANKEMAVKFMPIMLDATPVEYILTVPAVWSDAAKQATIAAAHRAGMPSVTLVSEPEAAAIECLTSMQEEGVSIGDLYVVCDIGGGTIDLITYEVTSVQPLRFTEVLPGEGTLDGGVFLDQRFIALVRTKVGDAEFQNLLQEHPKAWSRALHHWETVTKRAFTTSAKRITTSELDQIEVPFAGLSIDGPGTLPFGILTLERPEVAAIFEPTVQSTITMIENQSAAVKALGKQVTGVLLVGGTADSCYLHKRLCEHFSAGQDGVTAAAKDGAAATTKNEAIAAANSHTIPILKSTNAWTAVERGAAICGIMGSVNVTSRVTRFHYGVVSWNPFVDGVHSPSNKIWCDIETKYMADNQLDWIVQKGQNMVADRPQTMDFYFVDTYIPDNHTIILRTCSYEKAPAEFSEKEDGVHLVNLTVDLTPVPRHAFQQKVNSLGVKYYLLDYHVGLFLDSGNLRFDFRVDGKVYGSVQACFD